MNRSRKRKETRRACSYSTFCSAIFVG